MSISNMPKSKIKKPLSTKKPKTQKVAKPPKMKALKTKYPGRGVRKPTELL